MVKDEIARLVSERFAGSWLKDESGGSFLKLLAPGPLPGAPSGPLTAAAPLGGQRPGGSARSGRASPPERLTFLAESLVDDGRFLSLGLSLPEPFLAGEFVRDPGLVAELEGILALSLEDLARPTEHWIGRLAGLSFREERPVRRDRRIGAARIPGAQFGFAYGGAVAPSLATWLELWGNPEWDRRCPKCGGRLRVFAAGAGLSGGVARGRCDGCGGVSSLREGGLALRLFFEAKRLEERRVPEERPLSIGAAIRILESKGARA